MPPVLALEQLCTSGIICKRGNSLFANGTALFLRVPKEEREKAGRLMGKAGERVVEMAAERVERAAKVRERGARRRSRRKGVEPSTDEERPLFPVPCGLLHARCWMGQSSPGGPLRAAETKRPKIKGPF